MKCTIYVKFIFSFIAAIQILTLAQKYFLIFFLHIQLYMGKNFHVYFPKNYIFDYKYSINIYENMYPI